MSSIMELNAENIEQALYQFYHEVSQREQLDAWLTASQNSPQAWLYPWQLLQPSKSPEVQFFGASSLYVKITRHWHELSTESVVSLKNQLLETVCQLMQGPRIVVTRLSVSLAALILQTLPELWPDAIRDIIQIFSGLNNTSGGQGDSSERQLRNLMVLLEVLRVLPEEFSTSFLSKHRRGVVRNELCKAYSHIQHIVDSALVNDLDSERSEGHRQQALRCFGSWVQFGIPLQQVEESLPNVFRLLSSDLYFDSAVDALMQVFSHPDGYHYPNTMTTFLGQVIQIQPLLQRAIQLPDPTICRGLTKLIVCAADQNTALLLRCTLQGAEEAQLATQIVELVLQCSAMPGAFPTEEDCSDVTFSFWYNLQDEVTAAPSESHARLVTVFAPAYLSLVEILLLKSQFPADDEYQTWNSEEKEVHRCYRQDIADTLMYALNFLHNSLLDKLCNHLKSILERGSGDGRATWQELEAVFFAMGSVAESVDEEEGVYLPAVFGVLGQVQCTHPKVVQQALNLIGAYAEWISRHPETLGTVVPLLLQGIQSRDLAQSATLSLKEVLRENQVHIGPYAVAILEGCQQAVNSENLKNRDCLRLMACLGYVLATLPLTQATGYLNVFLGPQMSTLQELANQEPQANVKYSIQMKINMLGWMFGCLHMPVNDEENDDGRPAQVQSNAAGSAPVLLVLHQIIPVLKAVIQQWSADSGVISDVCDTFKRAMKTLLADIAPAAPEICSLILAAYSAHPHVGLLDLTKNMLILFATDAQLQPRMQDFFNAMCDQTLVYLLQQGDQIPDVADMFMAMLAQMTKKNRPLICHESCSRSRLLSTAVACLGAHELTTVRSAAQFLGDFLSSTGFIPDLDQLVAAEGGNMVDRVLMGVGGVSPRSAVDCLSDVILALNKHHHPALCGFIHSLLAQDGYPSPRATLESRQQFSHRVLTERVNKRKMRETIQEFALLWRGLLNTEYGRQTTTPII